MLPQMGNFDIMYTSDHVPIDIIYSELLNRVLNYGEEHNDRTGVGTISLFNVGLTWEFPFVNGPSIGHPAHGKFRRNVEYSSIPLLTGKKVHTKSLLVELVWFLRGETNIKFLTDYGVTIWNEWANEHGELGPVYGSQWRKWRVPEENMTDEVGSSVDQIFNLVDQIRNNPNSRRHMLVGYNPGVVHQQGLPACHVMAQFSVRPETKLLDMTVTQRSADAFLGVPFNIASYAMLQWLIGLATGYRCGKLNFNFGDFHIYNNHLAQVHKYLRNVNKEIHPTPVISFDVGRNAERIDRADPTANSNRGTNAYELFNKMGIATHPDKAINFGYENFRMEEYSSFETISAPVAV